MWSKIASILLRYRLAVLLIIGGLTVYMGSFIPDLRLVYEFGGLLPDDDETRIDFEMFVEHFGAEEIHSFWGQMTKNFIHKASNPGMS